MKHPSSGQARPGSAVIPLGRLRLGAGRGDDDAGRPLTDGQDRLVRYLRFSVVDRCNLRCRYCMPADGVPFVPRDALLSFEEMERLTRIFVGLGVQSVRLTGGEPLLRKGLPELVARLAAVPGIEDLALSTNAVQLAALARPLREAGVGRLNISLDSLRPDVFADLARMDALPRVLKGIEAARQAGFAPIKLNAVVIRGRNEQELPALVRFAAARGLLLRFIEFMPIGVDAYWSEDTFVPTSEMMEILSKDYLVSELGDFASEAGLAGGGPARYAQLVPRGGGEPIKVGFIAAMSHNFCSTCNRVRVTATGTLQECLAFPGQTSLRDLMRQGATDALIEGTIRAALAAKGPGHLFESGQFTYQSMSVTGG